MCVFVLYIERKVLLKLLPRHQPTSQNLEYHRKRNNQKQNAKKHTQKFSLETILPVYEDIYKSFSVIDN